MKTLIFSLITLTISTVHAEDQFRCFLPDVPYYKSPIATIEYDKKMKTTTLSITENVNSYHPIFETAVIDETDDVLALYTNEAKKVSLNFYLDEADALEFAEGSITSPFMNGNVKCMMVRN